jgi:hypothetical protein
MSSFRIRFKDLTDFEIKEVYFAFKFCRDNFKFQHQEEIYQFLKEELKFLGEEFLNSLDEIHNNNEASYINVYTAIDFTRLGLVHEMGERFVRLKQ